MQDLVPGFLKFLTRPTYGLVLRFLAFCFIVVGLVAAGLNAAWAGFTPTVWFLLALLAFMGVICNLIAQSIVQRQRLARRRPPHAREWRPPEFDEAAAATTAAAKPAVTTRAAEPAAEPTSETPAGPSWFEVDIYCVKCREKRLIRNPEAVELANGRPAYRGSCPVCGTKVSRIRKAE